MRRRRRDNKKGREIEKERASEREFKGNIRRVSEAKKVWDGRMGWKVGWFSE